MPSGATAPFAPLPLPRHWVSSIKTRVYLPVRRHLRARRSSQLERRQNCSTDRKKLFRDTIDSNDNDYDVYCDGWQKNSRATRLVCYEQYISHKPNESLYVYLLIGLYRNNTRPRYRSLSNVRVFVLYGTGSFGDFQLRSPCIEY